MAAGRKTGGRQAGTLNRATVERRLRAEAGLAAAQTSGELPLDLLLRQMRGDTSISEAQFQAAVAAAPYIHARLASSDVRLEADNTHRVVSDAPLSIDEWQAQFATQHANDVETSEQVADESEAAG